MSHFIRVGDKTTAGGTVLDGVQGFIVDGRAVSYEGARIYCPACQSEGVARIAMHQPMIVDLMGKRPLQMGDLCICGCSPPPTLISSQGFAGFGNGQTFQYHPAPVASGNTEKLAECTSNPDYAARMLGYDRNTFGDMIHVMKKENQLGGADNVLWDDEGNVYYQGEWIDNMHCYK
jgi:uncharacterized Zn-binding protein involved in type VI secretion